MKTRLGFVSNSSSCSFMCPICTDKFSGWDWDEDPVCPRCHMHIKDVKGTFIDYLVRKYGFDKNEEMDNFITEQLNIQREEERQEQIKNGDIEYD